MEKLNKVSIWVGRFNSENNFNKIIQETFDKDGNSSSIFMKNFGIDFINHDLQEGAFQDRKLTKDDLNGTSYAETFLDKIDETLLTGNGIILLYDFEYSGSIKNQDNISFIGVYDYKK